MRRRRRSMRRRRRRRKIRRRKRRRWERPRRTRRNSLNLILRIVAIARHAPLLIYLTRATLLLIVRERRPTIRSFPKAVMILGVMIRRKVVSFRRRRALAVVVLPLIRTLRILLLVTVVALRRPTRVVRSSLILFLRSYLIISSLRSVSTLLITHGVRQSISLTT